MVVLSCPITGCGFQTADVDVVGAAAILNVHAHAHTNHRPDATPSTHSGPKLVRPKIQHNSTCEDWNAFIRRWDAFRVGSGITGTAAPGQLLECTGERLGNVVLGTHPDFTSRTLQDALAVLKSIAVIPVALGVLRSDLAAMRQDPDEPFRTFAAQVQGKAETCEFKTNFHKACSNCTTPVTGEIYYTDEVIRDILLNGIADMDIRREALSTERIQTKPITDVIAFVESRETARNANPTHTVSSLSEYRRSTRDNTQQRQRPHTRTQSPTGFDQSLTAKCPDCSATFHLYTKKARGWNRRQHTRCEGCWKKNRASTKQTGTTGSISQSIDDTLGQISSIHTDTPSDPGSSHKRAPPKTFDHQIFSKGQWRRTRLTGHPKVTLGLTLETHPSKRVEVTAVADAGAQSNMWSLNAFLSAGFKMSDLSQVTLSLNAANKSPIRIDGAFFATFTGLPGNGDTISCRSMVYVSRDVTTMYLSYDTMVDLGIVNHSFPMIGQFSPANLTTSSSRRQTTNDNSPPSICGASTDDGKTCQCPTRTPVPPRPSSLPFPCTEENNSKMRDWLLDYFGGSTFNVCPHQELPSMTGPPVEIHLREDATPVARHKAIPVPVHWQEQVHSDLLRDEAMGVIERVPFGEPVEWCHRMVVTRKHDGSPRRTVDLSPLNKHCKRETHNSESPFHLARRIPRNTWKTVADAWNGYHSVPLRESDRHLTTFVTPFGRWRYARAPQGFLSSGDGYNRRFDAILAGFNRKERIVDDTLFHDENLEEHWWRAISFLSTVGQAGIVLNPTKFQFASREVDFAGFRITDERIDPLPKFYSAIENFPTPTCTTDIRSWFGLVNQVANYAQLREHMAAFRPFLSPRHPFAWTPELDQAFQSSKTAITNAIREGVEIFDLDKATCLRTDWSKKGVGYFLLQKHCTCKELHPDCCPGGWRITLAGSRFLTAAEQHYAPIEGEALAITWGLEQTKFFTLGCHQLLVATDHKPLIKVFGDRTLDEIPNTRLFRLKQRTLPWHFCIIHLPGKTNLAADAASRYPSPMHISEVDDPPRGCTLESSIAAAIRDDASTLTSITWERLVDETSQDEMLRALKDAIHNGFPETCRSAPSTAPYWQYRHSLHVTDGVIIYDDRVVMPSSLRPSVLDILHSAHQGTSTMGLRARSIVFWPGMTNDIEKRRQSCSDCIKNAPSQPSLPTSPAIPPSTPFEQTYSDFFDCAGQHYLVVGDRLSGWCDVFQAPKGSPQAGANGLISCLRNYFSRFGVPEELSSDGGPEFIANATDDFLSRWGVRHRLSSAYNPKSNGRAEVAVKSAKRLLRSNTDPSGTLDTDRFLRAMMQLRNTPDPDCNTSPAEIVFGRPIRDAFSFINRLEKFGNTHIHPIWREAWQKKEEALRQRFHRTAEERNDRAKPLPELHVGNRCYIQNQAGPHPKRWNRSGTVVEAHGHDSYTLKVDGTGRVTRRNRKYLRKFEPASPEIVHREGFTIHSSPLTTSAHPLSSSPPATAPLPTTEPPPFEDEPATPYHQSIPPTPGQPTKGANEEIPQDALDLDTRVEAAPTTVPSSRPRRATRPPRKYVPETGMWD